MLEFVPAHPVGAAKECADIRDLDMAEVQLTEHLCDDSVTTVTEDTEAADGNTNLRSNLRLYDDIERVEQQPSTTDCVHFRIGQFTHFTHDYLLSPTCCRDVSNSNVTWVNQV